MTAVRRAASWLVALGLTTTLTAQSQTRPTPPELTELREALKLTDPAAKLKALDDLLSKYPDSTYLVDVHLQKMTAIQAIAPVDLTAIDAAITAIKTVKTPRTPHEVLNLVAMNLTGEAVLGRAEAVEREALGMLDETTYVRDWQKRFVRHPDDAKEVAAQAKEGRNRYLGDLSRYHLVLGRILVKEGRDVEARAAFEKALAVMPLQGSAALALASLAEKAGDSAEAYRRLAWAAMTGRLPSTERPRLDAAFAKVHPGRPASDVDADLDQLYRDSFKNPVETSRYRPAAGRTTRTVLAEMFTGAGCVPCLSVDLSFDAMLERYARDELVVLMYHIHAPTPDPLSNTAVQGRSQYYEVKGAPTTFVDGAQHTIEGPRDDAPEAFAQLDALIGKRLTTAPAAHLDLEAAIRGSTVAASVRVRDVAGASTRNVRLQIALVERVVRYSGENALRFHPMVVRALGGADAGGFPLDTSKPEVSATQTFDLDALSAANRRYYDDYANDMKTRIGLSVSFLEYKHAIDPATIAVAAFLQDATSREILQAAFVTPATESRQPVEWTATVAGPPVAIHAGDTVPVRLSARLASGWHLYALTPTPQGPAATVIVVPGNQPFTLAGEIDQPPPQTAYDPNFDRETAFFEDAVTFVVPVKVGATARPGAQSIAVAVTYQMCDARLCLPPTQVTVSAPVTIR